jgi:hypothetical protein
MDQQKLFFKRIFTQARLRARRIIVLAARWGDQQVKKVSSSILRRISTNTLSQVDLVIRSSNFGR